MSISITGAKYTETVTSYSSGQIVMSGASFGSGDFSDQRIVGIWDSSGNYRGMAWVRRYISGTTLEMETDFIDKDGATITPVSTDVALVSLNFDDVSDADLSISNNVITLNDGLEFGVSSDSDGVCFYDEGKHIDVQNDNSAPAITFIGGLVVFGHLLDYEARTFFNPVSFSTIDGGPGGSTGSQILVNDADAKVWWLGGGILFNTTPARITVGPGASTPPEWQKWWGIETEGDLLTPSGGANWSTSQADQEFRDIISLPSGTNAIAFRLANSDFQGGVVKISGGGVISAFGSDAAGSYAVGASAGARFSVLDLGTNLSKTAFWRAGGTPVQSIVITNVICAEFKLGTGVNPGSSANANADATINFLDTYSNLVANSKVVILERNNSVIADSDESVSGGALELSVKYADLVGHALTVNETEWDWSAFSYGRQIVSGQFETSSVDTLSGSAVDVQHGAAVIQAIDTSITEATKATVDAYPITPGVSGSQITLTGDSATVRALTAAQFYDLLASYLYDNFAGESSTIVARSGTEIDAGAQDIDLPYINYSGKIKTTGTVTSVEDSPGISLEDSTLELTSVVDLTGELTNVTVDFQAAGTYDWRNATFSGTLTVGNTSGGSVTVQLPQGVTVTNNGPDITIDDQLSVSLTAANLIDGTRYQVYNVTQDAEIDNDVVSGGSGLSIAVSLGSGQDAIAGDTIRLRATYQSGTTAKLPLESSGVITASGLSFIDSQEDDTIYAGYGLDGSTITKFTADFVNDEIDLIVGSNFTGQEAYSWAAYILTTVQGIQEFFGGWQAVDAANIRINNSVVNVYFDNTTTTNVVQTDNIRIYRSDGAYPIRNPTTGGGGIDVVWRNQIFIAETGVSGLTAGESLLLADIANVKAVTDKVDDTLEDDGGTYRFTTNALEQAPSGGGGSADWTSGEKEQIRDALGVTGDTTTATGGQLQTIDSLIDAIKAITDNLPNSGALTDLASQSSVDTVDALIDAIKAVTDNLPNSGALTDIASQSSVNTIDGIVDAILVDTDATIPALIAALNDISASEVRTELETTGSVLELIYAILTADFERDGSGGPITVKHLRAGTSTELISKTETGDENSLFELK